jgi:hypothetical protein
MDLNAHASTCQSSSLSSMADAKLAFHLNFLPNEKNTATPVIFSLVTYQMEPKNYFMHCVIGVNPGAGRGGMPISHVGIMEVPIHPYTFPPGDLTHIKLMAE